MSELLKIVDFVRSNSVTPRISLARMSLMVGYDVNNLKQEHEYPLGTVEIFKKAALNVTGKSYS